jgi:Fe-S-cluster-containing dehydrogenase component
MAKYGFIIDVDRCNGCYSCFLACKDEWIGNDHGKYGKATAEGMNLMKVNEIEYGTHDKVKVDYIPIPCQHCKNAPCIAKRPDAFYARPDGLVILDPEKSADKALLQACPYGCVQWNAEAGIAQKCNGCAHMLDAGEKQTRCSECCPNQALIFGDLDDPESEISKFAAEHEGELEELHPSAAIAGTIKEVFPKSVPASEKTGAVRYMYIPKPFICGEVTAKGEDVKGAKVTLTLGGDFCTTETDFLGDFEFQGLARDQEYTILIEADGYEPVELSCKTEHSVNLGEICL